MQGFSRKKIKGKLKEWKEIGIGEWTRRLIGELDKWYFRKHGNLDYLIQFFYRPRQFSLIFI